MDAREVGSPRTVGYYAHSLTPSVASGLVTYITVMRQALGQRGVTTRIAVAEARSVDQDMLLLPSMRGTRRLSQALSRAWPTRLSGFDHRIAIARAARQLAREGISLLEFEERGGLCDFALRLRLPCPIVVRLHGPHFITDGRDPHARIPWLDTMERSVARRAAAVTAPSADTLRRAREHWQLDLPNALVIPNPTPTVEASECWAGRSDGPILFVGAFDNLKGFDVVVRAFRRIAQRQSTRELWLVGPQRELKDAGRTYRSAEEFLDSELPDRAARRRAKYLGTRSAEEIGQYRKSCACVVVASRSETFCLAASEALMAGCPVISSDAGALPELVEHEKSGLLFKSGSVESLEQ